jgi:ribosomal protein L40E
LSGYIFIFALGGLIYLLGAFIAVLSDVFGVLGAILMYTGLILTVLREDMMTMVITSGVISLGSLVSWIISLAGGGNYMGFGIPGHFVFSTLFYFLAFGAIAIVVFVRAEKFRQMRAASAQARAQMAGISCPRCGAFVPMNAAFCPACGVQNPAMQQYGAVPQAPLQYGPAGAQVPPVQPEAAPAPKCVNCGADIPMGAAFCAKCGAKQ